MDEEHNNEEYEPAPPSETSFIGEVWGFLSERKLFWLAPIVIVMIILGGLFFFAGSAGPLSPFIYMM